jgi:maltooligosyltrehalose trehalohydrolase
LDAQWDDDLHHSLHVALTGEQQGYYEDYAGSADVARTLEETFAFSDRYSPHRGRRHGRSALDVRTVAFVVSLQTHDLVGNRAAGERLHHLVGVDRAVAAASIVLLSPYVPMLFQGEELVAPQPFPYFADHAGDLGEAVRRGRAAEFAGHGWEGVDVPDPTAESTYRSAVIDWNDVTETQAEVLSWYRSLLRLRREVAELGGGGPRPSVSVDGDRVSMRRGDVEVVVNLGDLSVELPPQSGSTLLERHLDSTTGQLGVGGVVIRLSE